MYDKGYFIDYFIVYFKYMNVYKYNKLLIYFIIIL